MGVSYTGLSFDKLLQFLCSIPPAISLGLITALIGLVVGLARNRLIDDGDGHLGHFMVGGDLIVAAIAVSVAEFATKSILLSCGSQWTEHEYMLALRFAGVAIGILFVLMLSISHERVGLSQGPEVSLVRVVWSDIWGVLATLIAVGTATQWAFYR